jgi:hypothetical protein
MMFGAHPERHRLIQNGLRGAAGVDWEESGIAAQLPRPLPSSPLPRG